MISENDCQQYTCDNNTLYLFKLFLQLPVGIIVIIDSRRHWNNRNTFQALILYYVIVQSSYRNMYGCSHQKYSVITPCEKKAK